MSVLFGQRSRGLTWQDVWGSGGPRRSAVSRDDVLRIQPVYAAVSLISDQLSTMPLSGYQSELGGGRTKMSPQPTLLDQPDPTLTKNVWIQQGLVSALLRGNAYGLVSTNANGTAIGCRWLHPDSVTVDETGVMPTYSTPTVSGLLPWPLGPVLHMQGMTMPGKWVGLSPVGLFMEQYQTYAAATGFGLEWFENSATPSGILKNDKATLDADATSIAKRRFKESTRSGDPVVLDEHWSWESISLNAEESQFLATIKATATQIAGIFRVDPEDIGGEGGNSRKYSNREQDQQRLNTRTLLPWAVRFENTINRLLLPGQYAKFNLDGLARPDLLTRMHARAVALTNGIEFLDEVRTSEDSPEPTPEQISNWLTWFRQRPQPGVVQTGDNPNGQ